MQVINPVVLPDPTWAVGDQGTIPAPDRTSAPRHLDDDVDGIPDEPE